jgi:pyruvate,water dikinase
MVVNAAWGLGPGVADGSVAGDTAWVRCNDFSLEQHQIVEKPAQIILAREQGLQRAAVPVERRRAACLPEAWLERVAQFGVAAELLLGCPQDMEWAIGKGQIWVLQSRPITGLPPELRQTSYFLLTWQSQEEARSFWKKETGFTPEVMLPLEQDHLARLESTWEESCRLLGVERNVQFKFCNGRAYSRRMPIKWTEADRQVRHTAMEELRDRLQQEGRTTWDHWGPEIIKATERLRAFDDDAADGPALAGHLEEALAVGRRHFMLHPLCSFRPPPSFFAAFTAVTGISGIEAEEAAYRLLEGGETPLSQLVDGLYELACTAGQSAEVTALIADPPPDVLARLKALPPGIDFLKQLNIFLKTYGERTGNGYGSEAFLRTPTWQEQPERLLPLIAVYLKPEVEPPAVIRKQVQQVLQAQVEELCVTCDDKNAVGEFRGQLAYARKVYSVLETHNHYIDQMSIGQLRHAVMAAARWLAAQNALGSPEDVLWLRFDEILNGLQADTPVSFAEIIAARQAEYAVWSELEAPPLLGVPEARLPERPPLRDEVTTYEAADGKRLAGQGASAGRRSGRARVVLDTVSLPNFEAGDILVTHNVGPLWTPIFPMLGGLILESGAIGQHAAATAREYGIPAVVNVKHATQRIPQGAWVTIDGTAGTVELD